MRDRRVTVPFLVRSRTPSDILDTEDTLGEEEVDVDSILSSDGSLLDVDTAPGLATPVRPVRQSSGGMGTKHARLGLLQRLRLKLWFGSGGSADPEKANLVQRTPKKRSLKRQSLITVPTEVMLRALRAKMSKYFRPSL